MEGDANAIFAQISIKVREKGPYSCLSLPRRRNTPRNFLNMLRATLARVPDWLRVSVGVDSAKSKSSSLILGAMSESEGSGVHIVDIISRGDAEL